MHLGLIGGIGPAATVAYYERLVRTFRDAGRLLDLTIVHADVGTLARNALADDRAAQVEVYVGLIQRLKAAGADVAAITSIGGHFCFDELEPVSPLPLASAVAPIDAFFVSRGTARIGILGTRTVMETRLYGQLRMTEPLVPTGDLDALGGIYVEIAVSGTCTAGQRARLFAAGREMVERQGAEAVLLAGTDLGLAFDGHDPGFPTVDALDVHVEALFGMATGAGAANAPRMTTGAQE